MTATLTPIKLCMGNYSPRTPCPTSGIVTQPTNRIIVAEQTLRLPICFVDETGCHPSPAERYLRKVNFLRHRYVANRAERGYGVLESLTTQHRQCRRANSSGRYQDPTKQSRSHQVGRDSQAREDEE
ncbi:unnamed protein product [Lampetra planeri]